MSQDEWIFQLILGLGLLGVVPVGIYHRLRSQSSGETLDRRPEGLFILITLRPIGVAHMAGLLTYVLSPPRMSWSSVPLPLSLRWSGVALGAAAAVFLIWTLRSLGRNLTDTVVTRREHTLVTTGPYRLVRHPFYVASALATTANALVTANWFLAATGLVGGLLLVLRTPTEEQYLLERFGSEYATYRQTTGRFLPRVR